MTDVINWLSMHWMEVLGVVGAFAVIAAWTPNKSDDRIVQLILDAINFLGQNFGKARNDPKV